MQVKVQNQNILITGATGGIGRSIVKRFDGDNKTSLTGNIFHQSDINSPIDKQAVSPGDSIPIKFMKPG